MLINDYILDPTNGSIRLVTYRISPPPIRHEHVMDSNGYEAHCWACGKTLVAAMAAPVCWTEYPK